jgi:hypothetical protein
LIHPLFKEKNMPLKPAPVAFTWTLPDGHPDDPETRSRLLRRHARFYDDSGRSDMGDSRITKMKDGTTHMAYKAEHVVDLDSEFVLAAERSFAHVCETGGGRRTWLRGLRRGSRMEPGTLERPATALPRGMGAPADRATFVKEDVRVRRITILTG